MSQSCISSPQVAIDSSKLLSNLQNQVEWVYKSTIEGVKGSNYTYQYKSQTERLQGLMGRLSLGQCSTR
jgi:hypothetical protein